MKRVDLWLKLADALAQPRERVVAVCALLNVQRSVPDVAEELQIDFDAVADIAEAAQAYIRRSGGDKS